MIVLGAEVRILFSAEGAIQDKPRASEGPLSARSAALSRKA